MLEDLRLTLQMRARAHTHQESYLRFSVRGAKTSSGSLKQRVWSIALQNLHIHRLFGFELKFRAHDCNRFLKRVNKNAYTNKVGV